jgi:hypothetical protein
MDRRSRFLIHSEPIHKLVVLQSESTRNHAISSSLEYGLVELERRGISGRLENFLADADR